MGSIVDVLERAAENYIASFPTTEERRLFVESIRRFLADDAEIKGMPKRKRQVLLSGPIETNLQDDEIVTALTRAASAAAVSMPDPQNPALIEQGKLRAHLAALILRGLDPQTGKAELTEIERDFHRSYSQEKAVKVRQQNKNNRSNAPAPYGLSDALLITTVIKARDSLKTMIGKSKNDRARFILRRIGTKAPWKTPGALLVWCRRKKIEI